MEEVIKLWDLFGCDLLGLRVEGEVVREKMEEIIMKEGRVVVLDFEGVRGIAHTFADEIVGIFTRAFGKEWVKENIRVVNASESVRSMLNLAVKIALKQREKLSKT
jgi:alkylhydroperoxidase/carboxymuconolactone decarboxylase family protein YurZ